MEMCYKHSNKESIRNCARCGVGLCELCVDFDDEGNIICNECKNKVKAKESKDIELVFDADEKVKAEIDQLKDDVKNLLDGLETELPSNSKKEDTIVENMIREKTNSNHKPKTKTTTISSSELNDKIEEIVNQRLSEHGIDPKSKRKKPRVHYNSDGKSDRRYRSVSQSEKSPINSFFVLCLAFIPGFAHMYMGLTKVGLYLFSSSLLLTTLFGDIGDFSEVVGMILYVYAFCDAFNVKSKLKRGEEVSDSLKKFIAPSVIFFILFITYCWVIFMLNLSF
ncbi:MAG: hypothetical protein ACK5LV_07650 [Lachnospirales bacterium]